jgi:hypothetical protein
MLGGRYNPIVSQAEITGKGMPDMFSFRAREDTLNPDGKKRYPNGNLKENLFIMPGELLLARKNCRNTAGGYGRTTQVVFSSANGLTIDNNREETMREFSFAGFAKGEWEYGGENLFGTDPMDHGFAFSYAGSITTVNTGGADLYAFDRLCWSLPPMGDDQPASQSADGSRAIDTGLNPINRNRRLGAPQGKALIQIERYDPCDFSFQVAGAFELLGRTKTNGGVSDMTFTNFFDKTRKMTSMQQEAFAYSRGFLVIAAMAHGNSVAKMAEYGLFGSELSEAGLALLNNIFGRNVFPGSNTGNLGAAPPSSYVSAANDTQRYNYLRDHVFDLLLGGLAGSMDAKQSRIVGTAISSAKVNQSIDIMIRM